MDTKLANKRQLLASLISKDKSAQEEKEGHEQALSRAIELPKIRNSVEGADNPFLLTNIQQSYLVGRSGEYVLGNVATHNYFEVVLAELDIDRFKQAFNKLIHYHGMMRAVFFEDGRQRILPEVPIYDIEFTDLSDSNELARAQALEATRDEMSCQVYDVTQWPLFEIKAVKLGDHLFRVHFSLDMLIADAMSTMIIIKDLDTLYENPSQPLPKLEVTFKDYVEAEEKIKASELYTNAKAYWQARITSLPSAPELPIEVSPGSIDKPRFIRRQFILATPQWQALKAMLKQHGVSPSVLLVTVFSYVLAKWSKSSHFTLNLTMLNRIPLHEQINALVGDFTSLTMLEVNLDQTSSFIKNAQSVQSQLWKDIEHRFFDGVDVLRQINKHYGIQQSVSMPVVFTSALGLAGSNESTQHGHFLKELTKLDGDESFGAAQSSQVWIDHVVRESNGALGVSWDVLEELFPEGLIDAMFASYTDLVTELANGSVDVSDFVWVETPKSEVAIRDEVNDTSAPISDMLLHDLFYQQAAANGQSAAIKYTGGQWTYTDLEHMSRALSQIIHAANGGRTRIGILMHRGWEQVVAAMGVLGAGAAYVPIDANLPLDRVVLLTQKAEVSMLITQPWLAGKFESLVDIPFITISEELTLSVVEQNTFAPDTVNTDVAYMIYTSGSTGIPKGVVIDHRGAVNTILDINQKFQVTADDMVLALSSLSFDLSVYDIFGVLAAGGTIYIPDADRDKDPEHWVDILNNHAITIWNSVPALSQLLVDQLEGEPDKTFDSLRLALLSGDWIPVGLPPRLSQIFPNMNVISLGGATEASIWSIYCPITSEMAEFNSIPYGKPLTNQTFHVLDKYLEERALWVPGDLYIGGTGLALEYFNSPDKTNHSFIVHPKTKQRLYRTGDIGRYIQNGNIEFLGRDDNQVKVRGNRVELGEIEATINQHRFVQDSIVLAVGDKHRKRLVSYLLPRVDSFEDDSDTSLDEKAKLVFKLEQRGLRQFETDVSRVKLSALDTGISGVPHVNLAFNHAGKSQPDCPIELEVLGRWLFSLSQYKSEEFVLPKRFYPSPGSLYAVQTYLYVGVDAVNGLRAGAYYYDPSEHDLVLINAEPDIAIGPHSGIRVMIASDFDAIQPVYGGATKQFCQLEAGHLFQLLSNTASAQYLNVKPIETAQPNPLFDLFKLAGTHHINVCFDVSVSAPDEPVHTVPLTVFERQSFRSFDNQALGLESLQSLMAPLADSPLSMFVFIKASDTAQGRLLEFDGGSLMECEAAQCEVSKFGFLSEASFSILLFSIEATTEEFLAAGQAGQSLMSSAPKMDIGLCPIGIAEVKDLLLAYPQLGPLKLLYSLEGGRISKQQLQTWEQERFGASYALEELKQHLKKHLPMHMIPSAFMVMDTFPLTANDKVDRKSLPAFDDNNDMDSVYMPPTGPVEKALCEIWQNVLSIKKVGVDDNFFEVGGDSLMVTRVITQIKSRFASTESSISIADFFENPTVKLLSHKVGLAEDEALLAKNMDQIRASDRAIEQGEL